ncbi:MAG: hypothetical protein ACT4QE_04170 [Anaerolineales bacterium]
MYCTTLFWIGLSLIAAACNVPGEGTPTPTPAPTPTEVGSGEWVTYTNAQFGFSLQHPKPLQVTLLAADGSFGYLGDFISFAVSEHDPLECRGDCPVVDSVERGISIGNQTATRFRGSYGAVGGNAPHEYLAYLFEHAGRFYTFTLHAVARNATTDRPDVIAPLSPFVTPQLELILATLQFN